MESLNYHHLLYFRLAAREGSMSAAGRRLDMSHATISGQVAELEEALGHRLFDRSVRGLQLTPYGEQVLRYADEIYNLGQGLLEKMKGPDQGGPQSLAVGVAPGLPSLLTYRLLEPMLAIQEGVHLTCKQDSPDRLISDLHAGALDLALVDAQPRPGGKLRTYNHLLGECGLSFFASAALARTHRGDFPACLDGAPFLLPPDGTAMRQSLATFFEEASVQPHTMGEFFDSNLMYSFGQAGGGFFAAPTVLEAQVKTLHEVKVVGREPGLKVRFHAISLDRRIKHRAALALCQAAKQGVFA